jgi:GNAT superfamily N-acetyltransferase
MEADNTLVGIRPMELKDSGFVTANWLKHYKNWSPHTKRIPRQIFFRHHHALLQNLIARPFAQILIAHLPEDSNVILGFLAIEEEPEEEPLIHFIFVKEAFRKFGIAKSLLEASKLNPNHCQITHWTEEVETLSRKFPKLKYNPYRI